jgi:Rrf2 family protein
MSVIYSDTCGYAIHAVTRLADLQDQRTEVGGPAINVGVGDICEGSGLSTSFTSKILHQLARSGLLRSTKGRGGGFRLNRPASKIRLLDIVEFIDGVDTYRACAVSSFERCNDKQPCPQHESFKPIREQIIRYLGDTTVRDLVEGLRMKLAHPTGPRRRTTLPQTEPVAADDAE